jgi:hypothetical protein
MVWPFSLFFSRTEKDPVVKWSSTMLRWYVEPDPYTLTGEKEIRKAARFFAEELREPERAAAEVEYAKKIRKAVMEANLKNGAISASEERIKKGIK